MIKNFNEFDSNKVNEEYTSTQRNYGEELNKISSEVEAELYSALEYCMENGIFEKEDLGRGEFWYKFPTTVGVNLNWTNDMFAVSEFMPEGEKVGNYTIGKGGYLFGELDNNNEHQVDTNELDVWGMIDLLKEVRTWVNKDNG
ncbi:MAG: hypothetical protein SLAVMIC_00850 [uncultured marine phage]|uniref:Uncharacterized protein n=1 Tax=uncultured marine phage TaxID=707152 RepID=A0A8D9CEW8_9VIRU|nr:MAG: hypothetical protein SLAVMIC_00850 [uncultured marine phage]